MPVLPCDARTARVADYECPRGRPSTAITEDQGAIGGPELYRPQSEGLAVGHNPGILIDRMVTQDGLIDVPGYRVIPVRIDRLSGNIRMIFKDLISIRQTANSARQAVKTASAI